MKLAAHELYGLNERAMSCVNSITNMAYAPACPGSGIQKNS